jgi:transcription factor SFP1
MDYSISRFSSSHASTDSDMTALPSTSFPRTKLETTFCRNFKCCGQGLENLHDLLQHYEEKHVKFEDDEVPSMVTDDDNSASSSATSSQPPSPKTTNAAKSPEALNDTFEESSAFDTAIMRSSPIKGGKKRSFGQFSNGNNNANVHQSLRRALIDGGVGRSSSKASSVYSANSPFSTPGSSLPGTPKLDTDGETAFFGSGNNVPAFSSLSIRGAGEDHDLPSCAPPNLFFPAAGGSSSASLGVTAPAAKRERISSINSAVSASTLENNLASPGGAMGDRPYKCQSPGCDKAYKQMNGLKYHRLHGQCNQNALAPPKKENTVAAADKAASIVPPAAAATAAASSTPGVSASTLSTALAISAALNEAANKPAAAAAAATASKAAASSSSSAPITASAVIPTSTTSSDSNDGVTTPSPSSSTPGSPRSSSESISGDSNTSKVERAYLCQVGQCGKRYKNLNGLRYHYHHSGSHGLLGLQLLAANGGGPSARADASTGRPAVSTSDLSNTALAAAAQAAAAQQQANQRNAAMQQQDQSK